MKTDVTVNLERFEPILALTCREALRSPDPSTQNGAVLVADRVLGEPVIYYETLACNEFPFGTLNTAERWERPTKYPIVVHAERNSLFKAAAAGVRTRDLTMVCPWAACAECAQGIVQSGVQTLVTLKPQEDDTNARWDSSISVAMSILQEGGVQVVYWTKKVLHNAPPLRRNGELWQP